MGFVELFLIGVGLSMDAFAVSICKGLSLRDWQPKVGAACGLYFGGFQALMPLIGYYCGTYFADMISSFDHWIAFILLAFIGGKMALESREQAEHISCSTCPASMLPLAIATSIDALAVGISFALLDVNIFYAITLIGITTGVLSFAGVRVGNVFGAKYKSRAELAGGLILVGIGIKILLEGLGLI